MEAAGLVILIFVWIATFVFLFFVLAYSTGNWDPPCVRYWTQWRRFVLWLSDRVPETAEEMLLDYLYPDCCVISFE